VYQTYTTDYRNEDLKFNYDYMNYNTYYEYQKEAYFTWNSDDDGDNSDNWEKNWNTGSTSSDMSDSSYVPVDYDKSLNCGNCLRGGWIWCQEAPVFGFTTTDPEKLPLGFCCHDTWNCPNEKSGFECSNQYTDPLFAYSMCPNDESKCGKQELKMEQYDREVNCGGIDAKKLDCTIK